MQKTRCLAVEPPLRIVDFSTAVMGAYFKPLFLSLIVFVLAAEAGSFLVIKYLQQRGMFYTPHADLSDYEDYLKQRDPLLGWTRLSDEDKLMADGSRYSPAFAADDSQLPCASLYGDSFVWADEVDDAHAWSNLLATRLGCRVANFGVRAYGTDQAYLRYLHSPRVDTEQVVVLGYLTENLLRNITQDFDLLYGLTKYGLKPRFIIDTAGQLKLIPLPEFSLEEFERLNRAPEQVLEYEYLQPLYARFPYSVFLMKAFAGRRIQAKLRGEPPYAVFYRPDHASNALAVTVEILNAFVDEAKVRGDKPLVLVIPNLMDLRHFKATGTWFYAPLLAELDKRNIAFIDVGPGLLAALQGHDAQTIYAPRKHFNEEGNRLLTELVYETLRALGLRP
jgi:hypothetical protein